MMHRRSYANLAQYLEKTGTSNAALARRLKINPSYISLILTGRRVPSLRMAARIADACNIPIDSLLRLKLTA